MWWMKTKSGSVDVDVVDEDEERWSRLLGTRPSSLQIVLRSDQVTQSGAELNPSKPETSGR